MKNTIKLRHLAVLFGMACAFSFAPGDAAAEMKIPVTLTAKDGSLSVAGNLIAVEAGYYVLRTPLGDLRLPVELVNCDGIACPVVEQQTPRFGIHGSRTVGTDLIPNLMRGFAKHKGVSFELIPTDKPKERIIRLTKQDGSVLAEIDLQTYGSGSAFKSLAAGNAQIGLADRQMKDSDLLKLQAAGIPELRETSNEIILGLDGIVVMLNRDNPVRNLTTEQIARIYAGEITNWAELGGPDAPVVLNSFDEGSGDRSLFIDRVLAPYGLTESENISRHKAYKDAVDGARNNLGGIAYASRVHGEGTNIVSIRESCGLLTSPTNFRVKTEGYFLSRRLYMYKKPDALHPVAKEFIEWSLTDAAQPYIVETGFIDRAPEFQRLEDMGMQMIHTVVSEPEYDPAVYSEMLTTLRGAERLSMAVRFHLGSATLDAQALRDLDDLAKALSAGQYPNKEVMLVGFADSIGKFNQNRHLAFRRAEAARAYLESKLPRAVVDAVRLTTLSYGELMPLLCNESDDGRQANRRVEIWMRTKESTGGIATATGLRKTSG